MARKCYHKANPARWAGRAEVIVNIFIALVWLTHMWEEDPIGKSFLVLLAMGLVGPVRFGMVGSIWGRTCKG